MARWNHLYANHNTEVKIEYFKAHCTMVPLLMQRPEMQSPDISVMILQSSWDGSSGEEAEQLKAAVFAYAEAIDPGLKKGLRTVVDRLYVQIANDLETLEVTHVLEYTGTAWMDFIIEDVKQRKVPNNSKLLQYFEKLVASPYFYQKEKAAEVIDLLKSIPPEPKKRRRK